MAITVSGTSITFNDATAQTTAYPGIPANLAVGSIAVLYYFSATGVAQGSNVVSASAGYATNTPANGQTAFDYTYRSGNVTVPGAAINSNYVTTAAVTGTWRALSAAPRGFSTTISCASATAAPPFLAIRVA